MPTVTNLPNIDTDKLDSSLQKPNKLDEEDD
jgi:hypothetical protein